MKAKRSMRWSDSREKRRKGEEVQQVILNKAVKNDVKIVSFNCNGFNEMSENDTRDLMRTQKPGLVGVLETKLRREDGVREVEIPDYAVVDVRRSDLAGDKEGGGILVYCKQGGSVKYKERVFKVKKENNYVQNERVWVVARAGRVKWAVCFVYMGHQKANDEFGSWNDGIYGVLNEEIHKLKSEGFMILLSGDMNGWVGAGSEGVQGNDTRVNSNGERLITFLKANDMKFLNGSACCSGVFTRHGRNSATLLDYVCVEKENAHLVKKVMIDEFGIYGGGSDHVYVISTVAMGYKGVEVAKQEACKKTTWNFNQGTDWERFRENVEVSLGNVTEEEMGDIDLFGERMTAAAMKGLEEVVGRTAPGVDRKPKLYPRRIRKAMESRRLATSAWRKAAAAVVGNPSERNREDRARKEEEKDARNEEVEGMLSTFSNLKRSEVLMSLEEKTIEATKKFWRYVVVKNSKPASFSQIERAETGEILTDQAEIKGEMENFLKNLFLGDFVPCEDKEEQGREGQSQEEAPGVGTSLSKQFTVEEVQEVIKTLKNEKAMGVDNLPAEVLKNASPLFVKMLTRLFNGILEKSKVPDVWKTGRVVMVHKAGSKLELGNYRPLTVICTMSALFSKVLTVRLTDVVEEMGVLGEIQQGFRKGRCGADNNFVLHTILQQCSAKRRRPHMAFIDIKKVG